MIQRTLTACVRKDPTTHDQEKLEELLATPTDQVVRNRAQLRGTHPSTLSWDQFLPPVRAHVWQERLMRKPVDRRLLVAVCRRS
jgi:hypothetical protein